MPTTDALDEPTLLDAVLATPEPVEVAAVLLCGSFARGQDDDASDVDVLALVRGDRAYVRLGRDQGRAVEVLYLPVAKALAAPIRRSTLAGARILYDPAAVAAAWLARLQTEFERPYHPDAADAAYARWDLGQGLRALEASAAADDVVNARYLRGVWVGDLVAYVLASRGVWAPTRRRQLEALRTCDEAAHRLVAACLAAHTCAAVAAACRRAFGALIGPTGTAPLAEATLVALAPA